MTFKENLGTQIGKELEKNDARLLPAPHLEYFGGQKPHDDVATGGWNLRGFRKFKSCGMLEKPAMVFIGTESPNENIAKSLITDLEKALRNTGIRIKSSIQLLPPVSENKIEDAIGKIAKEKDFLFVILPNESTDIYTKIKDFADRRHGIHTLCAIGQKILTMNRVAYMANLALKVNLKLGGSNHLVGPGNLQFIHKNTTMIVGIDVTHPSPSSSADAPSVAGMVASIDTLLGQWPGILRAQQSRQEIVTDLQMMLESRLDLWIRKGGHKEYPENIIVYRDGVSEGQYHTVLNNELPPLRQACANKYPPGKRPKITLVVVGKRHNTRFYSIVAKTKNKANNRGQSQGQQGYHQGKQSGRPYYGGKNQPKGDENADPNVDNSGNLKPGLLVDTGVTEHGIWDFYLQSHAALQGTAKPAHYVVLLDEVFNRSPVPPGTEMNVADKVHMMTQGLCYMFGRATRSVSYCTPAYYADILCERSRRYLNKAFNDGGDNKSRDGNAEEGLTPAQIAEFQRYLEVHPKLKDTMFYL
jgi:eukaryotic translation initiation factor 2C